MRTTSRELIWQQVTWPTRLDNALALSLLHRLAADTSRQTVILEARCVEGEVTHLVGTGTRQAQEVAAVITSLVPGTIVSPTATARSGVGRSTRMRIRPRKLLLDVTKPSRAARVLLGALTEARFSGEEAAIQIVLGHGTAPYSTAVRSSDPTQSLFEVLVFGARRASPEQAKRMRDKGAEAGFAATVRVGAIANSVTRQTAILGGIAAGIRTLQSPGMRVRFAPERRDEFDTASRARWGPLHLSSAEVLSLLAWPLDAEDLPGIAPAHPKLLPLGGKALEKERVFASTSAPGTIQPLGIGIQDALFHTVITGPTGSGKSTILLNLVTQDLLANRGLVVIDPKADLVQDILRRCPPHRRADIVILDPTQAEPVGLNPLVVPGSSPELIADGILAIFRDLFPNTFGPRVDDVTHASILTLAHHPGATLTWLPRLLSDAPFRARLIGGLDDSEGLGAFWAQYQSLSPQQQMQFMAPVLSRLRQFLLRPSLRRVLDQSEPRFALDDIFTKRKVLLVPLNAGLLGNDASRLLGSLLVGQLWQHTLARATTPMTERSPVSIYIDEMQEFLRLGGDNLADALARSRSLGVAWHLAHQYRGQVPDDVRAAVDANARNKITFGLGIKDAREMAAMAPQLVADDFAALPQHAIYANLMRDGQQTGWVSGRTLPPPPILSNPSELIAASQARYGRRSTADGTEEPLSGLTAVPPRQDASIGRRKRSTS